MAVKFGDCYNSKDIVRHLLNEVATYKALEPLQGTCIPRLVEHGYTVGAVAWAKKVISQLLRCVVSY